MVDQQSTAAEIQDHMYWTYITLRMGMAVTAFIFPPLLYFVGKWVYDIDLQASMSAYFFASPVDKCTQFPVRTFFVGLLFAIGGFLYLYKGLTSKENWALNIAGVAAIIVAIFPESVNPADPRLQNLPAECQAIVRYVVSRQGEWPVHGAAAFGLFACLVYVAIRRAPDSLRYLPTHPAPHGIVDFFYGLIGRPLEKGFKAWYWGIGAWMLLSPGIAVALNFGIAGPKGKSLVYFAELAGVWGFAAYWAIKTIELSLSRAEELLLKGTKPSAIPTIR